MLLKPHGTCMCGKGLFSEVEAKEIIKNKILHSKNYYKCPLATSDIYRFHLTKQSKVRKSNRAIFGSNRFKFYPDRVMKELQQDMARKRNENRVLREAVVKYMRDAYDKDGTYRHTTLEVVNALQKIRTTWNKGNVATELSHMKTDSVLINLEKVPGGKGTIYIGLVEIMDKITSPTTIESVAIPTQKDASNVMTEVAVKTPATIPVSVANPFDKVHAQLSEIQKVLDKVLSKPEQSTLIPNQLVDSIMGNLTDLNNPNALIYRIREEIGHGNDEVNRHISEMVGKIDGSDEYKRGIKDGISMAMELGLVATKV